MAKWVGGDNGGWAGRLLDLKYQIGEKLNCRGDQWAKGQRVLHVLTELTVLTLDTTGGGK